MSLQTLEAACRMVFGSGLVEHELSVVWHAGEPMALPVAYYRRAFATMEALRPPGIVLHHHMQTNGTLLDAPWCAFIREHGIHVGISLDGPAPLHDRHRRTRAGAGTHARVMAGLALLREHGIPFHVICLLTRDSLADPDGLFDFFAGQAIRRLCFNIEEIEGVHTTSSLAVDGIAAAFAGFFERIVDRWRGSGYAMRIREIDDVLALLRGPGFGTFSGNPQNQPLAMLAIGHDGSVSTFSPELLGLRHPEYGGFVFGHVGDGSLDGLRCSQALQRVDADIQAGVRICQDRCPYFAFCRGGAPANKLAENGTFASSETLFCRLTQKTVIECVLRHLDRTLPPVPAVHQALG